MEYYEVESQHYILSMLKISRFICFVLETYIYKYI